MFDTDVFVLGGGPSGLAAAIAIRREELHVTVADAGEPPIDKACGEGLMPDALHAARALGIEVPRVCGYSFRGIEFQQGPHHVRGDFPDGAGLGVRRTVLQPLMVKAAAAAGAELRWRTPVTGIAGAEVSLGSKKIRARWIIGADGSQSSVRRWALLDRYRRNSQRFSYRRHYRTAPWSDYMQIQWGHHCQFYVTPVSDNKICLVLMTRDPHQRVADALPNFPELEARLRGAEATTAERGAYAVTRKLHRVTQKNIALVGDASGNVDPITGEGLCLAFKQAAALAKAISENDLSLYEAAHRNLSRRPRFMADFMLLMDRSTILQSRTMRAFQGRPNLFQNILAMHVGESSPARFAATAAVLGWQVLTV